MINDTTVAHFESEEDFTQAAGVPVQPTALVEQPAVEQAAAEQPTVEQPVGEQVDSASENLHQETKVSAQRMNESDHAYNFRLMREKQEELERKNRELQQELERKQRKQLELADDELAEGKHVKQVNQNVEELKQQLTILQMQQQIRTQYPDFDAIVNEKNLQALAKRKPMKWSLISEDPNLFRRWAVAYEEIKEAGLQNGDPYEAEKRAIKQNLSKPKSAATIAAPSADTPLSKAHAFAQGMLTEDKKRALYQMSTQYTDRETW